MNLKPLFLRFISVLTILLVVSFVVHYFILSNLSDAFEINLLIYTYLSLFGMTALIVFAILKFQKKYFDQVGFLFLVGSMLKFALYFVLLKPYYLHFELSKSQAFLVFFIPYIISLIAESVYVSKLLNKLGQKG